jgi:hypothetical protein
VGEPVEGDEVLICGPSGRFTDFTDSNGLRGAIQVFLARDPTIGGPGITRPDEHVAKLSDDGTICVDTKRDGHVIVDAAGHGRQVVGHI